MSKRKKLFSFRTVWRLRYRMYAIIVMFVLIPILYASSSDIPPVVDAIGYKNVQETWIANRIEKAPIVIAKTPDDQEIGQVIIKDGKKIYLDRAGRIITDELKKAGYDTGFISSDAFVDLNLPVPIDTKKDEVTVPASEPEPPKEKTLDDIVSKPVNPQRTNFLRYPAYNINAPVIYSSLEDLFNKKANCDPSQDALGCIDPTSPRDNGPVDSPIQQKLRDGVVHIAFTPQPGEIGNSYIVGHSSNFSYVKSAYNSIFKPLEKRSQPGQEFYIYDRFGRELKFVVFEAKEIREDDTAEAYKNYPGQRVVTLQTSILELVPGKGYQPTKRWLTRGELVM
jgi:hypothetical protein